MARHGCGLLVAHLSVAEVEAGQPLGAVLAAGGDGVQLILHGGGEVIVHQLGEVVLQQAHHREGNPGGHQRVATGEHVAAVLDGLDDGRIRRRAADAQVFHLLDQAGLGIARRRIGGVAVRAHRGRRQRVALLQVRQAGILAGALGGHVLVGLEEARKRDGAAGGGEVRVAAVRGGLYGHLHGRTLRVRHLAGHGALPNELVELVLLGVKLACQLARGGETLAGGADGLVGLLGVFHLAVIGTRSVGDKLRAEDGGGGPTCGVEALLGQGGRVGTHISNVAVLVKTLRNAHGALRGVVQAAAGLLLQRRRHERGGGFARVRLVLDAGHGHGGALQSAGQLLCFCLLDDDYLVTLELTLIVEVTARGHALAVQRTQACVEVRGGLQRCREIPVLRGDERHALTLALHNDAGSHRLHAASRQARHDLLPQHRGDLVAVEAVQDAAGLLGIDEVLIELTGVFRGLQDGGLGDLVEDHAAHRHLGLEHL